MNKSRYYSKKAYEKKKREKKEKIQKENSLRNEIEKIMNEGRKKGISYKKNKKNISDGTHKNNISAVSAFFKELKIYKIEDLNQEKIMDYFEEQKHQYDSGDITKGGFIMNRIKALQRFYDSVKVARGVPEKRKEKFLENADAINDLDDWKKDNKIVKSKSSSRYLKPDSDEQKLINDRFRFLKSRNKKNEEIDVANDFHRFSAATGARIDQGVNSTLENLKKMSDGRYLFIVKEGEDKTNKPRIKFVENKNDIKFLDALVSDAKARADKHGNAYLFEVKKNGDNLSREKIKANIQKVYRENFRIYDQINEKKVRGRNRSYKVTESFVPHSSRSVAIQREIKARTLRYKRSPNRFFRDLKEMIENDNSKALFKKDKRGAIAYGYDQMRRKLKRELTVKERAMYLASCSAGHNRINVMRDHYFSRGMNKWFEEKGIA